MMNEKYSAGLVKKQTFFREMIEVANLVNTGVEQKELKKKLVGENILKITPERRNQEISSVVVNRIKYLNNKECKLLAEGTLNDKRAIALIAILKAERLLREFMDEVYFDKVNLGLNILEDIDFNVFMRRKAEESDDVGKWKEVSVKKLIQVMKKILRDLEFIKDKDGRYEIHFPFPSSVLEDVIYEEDPIIKRIILRR